MKKNNNNKPWIIIIFIFILCVLANINDDDIENITNKVLDSREFRLISSSENEVFDKELMRYAKENNIDLKIDYDDTLKIIKKLNKGEVYDALWLSNSIWTYTLNSNIAIKNSKSTSINPIVFAITKSKAEELGFINKDVYMKDILNAISSGKLTFSMSNPVTTNSGASAYFGILNTLAGNPEVLTSDILNKDEIKEQLKTFFSGMERSSGSEDYLEELFLKGNYNAVITYESSIININKELEKNNKEPLYAIYPVDGVSISDSPLAYIDNKIDRKQEEFNKLQSFILSNEGQKILATYGRRTWYGGVNPNADKTIFNPAWGIDTSSYVNPVKYPSTTVMKEALRLYQSALRKPVHVVFCLDYSGSMQGSGIKELIDAMEYILTDEAEEELLQFSDEDKIDIIPFETNYKEVWSTMDGSDIGSLLDNIKNKRPSGSTALFPAVINAIDLLGNAGDDEKYNTSVIVMTDGMGNVGTFNDLEKFYKSRRLDIPVYAITFGYASREQLGDIATLTNGRVFDGTVDLIDAFKEVRGYN